VVPEDDAYARIANGFLRTVAEQRSRRVQVMPEAGGWLPALAQIETDLHNLRKIPNRRLLLLIDFDKQSDRRQYVVERVPQELRSRVYLLASLDYAEAIKGLGHLESIGFQVGEACQSEQEGPWKHPLLAHNETELSRLATFARPLLFGA
jgi:hypothetical protein